MDVLLSCCFAVSAAPLDLLRRWQTKIEGLGTLITGFLMEYRI
jgi:hypothetical protein